MIRKTFAVPAAVAALLLSLGAQAQNIAIVNGKPVPQARLNTLVQQAERAGQQVTPELQAQAKLQKYQDDLRKGAKTDYKFSAQ